MREQVQGSQQDAAAAQLEARHLKAQLERAQQQVRAASSWHRVLFRHRAMEGGKDCKHGQDCCSFFTLCQQHLCVQQFVN